ncbi:VOC family protein [Sphingomonas canadensis]|uniref:VOC family protein n=1 Tax=Sphingomonas canadensis TaxID=1219257 RepID=A0ABW3H542_9SPHN|nr:VOC family protein [Sphingomonas canadensis]MCW3836639.1 lactoylglutathione lyase [Sphingomonas canadensis]
MPQMVFINLPVADVARATQFYKAIGCTQDTRFSGPHASSMQLSDTIVFMLLAPDFFQGFTPRKIADAREVTEVLVALNRESRAAVDAIVAAAAAAGGRADPRAPQDMGFMYSRAFEDPDGHIFEPFFMDEAAAAAAMAQPAGG